MPRAKGSGRFGTVRSLRLPTELDQWFEERLKERPHRSASDLLLEFIHAGLRMRRGYMRMHYAALCARIEEADRNAYDTYICALEDTFDSRYVEHLLRWLEADGFVFVDNNA